MKRKILFSALAIFCLLSLSNAQTAKRICGTMDHLEMQKQMYPGLEQSMQEYEQFTQNYLLTHIKPERAVVTIPVVVHVVYNSSSQNISDALINAQLAQLNADYAKLNSDLTTTSFSSLAANTNVQFCLAQRDPNGNPSTGIVRKQTTVTSFTTNDNVKRSANGGDNAWPAASYLNLWVCNLGGGLLGYAQFPTSTTSDDATDGVVVLYSSVGSLANPGTASPYNFGRTATHEVGHWLNLYHIWGDDGSKCTGTDNVSDTPNQGAENYGCPAFPRTDGCSPSSPGVMFMNYMDYTDDGCMNMFSQGQATRMNALFATGGIRNSIVSSLGCVPPDPTSCGVPASLSSSGITTTSATLSWSTVTNATSYNLQYRIVGTSTWTSLNNIGNQPTITGLTPATQYEFQAQAVCASGNSNFSSSATFVTQSVSTGCADAYESNNSQSAAKTIAVNTNINALIGTSTDVDWFKFSNTSASRRIKVTLTNLPFDYDLKLYKSNGSTIATSQNSGTLSESIIYNTSTVGTYYIRVYGYAGAFSSSSCYTLNASISANNFREIGNGVSIDAITGAVNLYPNPTNGKTAINYISEGNSTLTFTAYDVLGRKVYSETNDAFEGPNTFYFDFRNLDNGVYLMEVNNGKTTDVKRFMVQK